MSRRVRIFLNPNSGTASGIQDQLTDLFRQSRCPCVITPLRPDLDLASILRPDEIAVSAGGDGTVNTVANAVVRTGNPMAVLPVGTLNHFARDLKLPLDLLAAVCLTATGSPSPVDAAEVNGIVFVNNSSLGAYPAMVFDRERLKRGGWNKWISLLWASVRAFLRFRCLQVELTINGTLQRHTTPFLFAGNNEYCMEGLELGSRACLTAGRLFLYLAPGISRLGVLRLALAALFGRLRYMPEFQQFSVESFSVNVKTRHRLRVSYDGEVCRIKGPLHYRILPGALQVIQPERVIKPDASRA